MPTVGEKLTSTALSTAEAAAFWARVIEDRNSSQGEMASTATKQTTKTRPQTARHITVTFAPTRLSRSSRSSVPAERAMRLTATPLTSESPATPCAGMKPSA